MNRISYLNCGRRLAGASEKCHIYYLIIFHKTVLIKQLLEFYGKRNADQLIDLHLGYLKV